MINILAGLLNVRLHTFVIATFFGIIPGSFVYISLGNGLSTLFKHGKHLNVNIIFQLNIILPLLGLTLLALTPIIYKKIKQRGSTNA